MQMGRGQAAPAWYIAAPRELAIIALVDRTAELCLNVSVHSHLESGASPEDIATPQPERSLRSRRASAALMVALAIGAVAIGLGTWLSSRNLGIASDDLALTVPTAPRLQATNPDEHVYRIDASRSTVSYSIVETVAGSDRTTTGSTSGIAGDVLLDEANPANSRIGDIVVDVQQLTSDQELRDRRLRGDFLESDRFPLVTLRTTKVTGLPERMADDTDHHLEVTGDLTVRDQTRPATFDTTVRRTGEAVHLKASSTLQLSTFGIGPISIPGFVTTSDDVTISIDAVAVPAEQGVPSKLAAARSGSPGSPGSKGSPPSGAAPSFNASIRPILESSCASCHTKDAVGSHAWRLTTADDASEVASGLALATSSRYMPPWPAGDGDVPLQHDRRLSPEEIAQITAWADGGAPLDVDPSTPLEPTSEAAGPTIRPDISMTLPEPYQGSTAKRDDYRCFILDPGLDHPVHMTGYEFDPDQTPFVHHATITRVTAAGRRDVDRVDAATPGPGWSCTIGAPLSVSTDGPVEGTSGGGSSIQVTAWAPGQAPTVYPSGTGVRLEPGDFFLIQIHYHVAHPPPPDRSTFRIQTVTGATLREINAATYFAPVEIPCAADQHGPLCERDQVLTELGQLFGAPAALLPFGINTACGVTPEQFASETAGVARSSCTHQISSPSRVVWVMGHEHEIGASFKLTINAGKPDQKVLLDLDRWSFNWQLIYQPAEDVDLEPGDTVTVECSWDRARRPNDPDRYITWAEGSEDEMCLGILATSELPP